MFAYEVQAGVQIERGLIATSNFKISSVKAVAYTSADIFCAYDIDLLGFPLF